MSSSATRPCIGLATIRGCSAAWPMPSRRAAGSPCRCRTTRAPSHVSAVATVRAGPWRDRLAGLLVTDPLLPSEGYYDLLAPRAKHLDMWETEYLQVLEGENPVVEWTKGTILAPLLAALDPAERAAFEADYARRVRQAYPPRPDGRTLFPFRRLFIVAQF